MTKFLSILSLISVLSTSAFSSEVNEYIREFHENPSEVMNSVPEKTPVVGDESMLDNMVSPFGHKPLGLGDIVEIKDEGRGKICRIQDGIVVCGNDDQGRAGIQHNDNFRNVVDASSSYITKLSEVEPRNLMSRELSVQPWSDDYWAIANGVLAHRYAHESGEKEHLWDQALQKFKATPTSELIEQNLIYKLSPAEKYDLLVGDKNFTLTKAMFEEGRKYFDRSGEVEPWMGICHGWAAAAYMLPRPKKVVWVKSADGQYDIPFYPSDIKSLGSLIYAKNDYPSTFIGGRCNVKDPAKDENGRVIDQKCFDTNPGTWHFAVINQVGVNDRSLVMDATFDYEVWNQPIISYNIRYFNPESMSYVYGLSQATVTKYNFKRDKFKKYRDPRAQYFVGVEMEVKYIVETSPSHNQMDGPRYDGIKSVTYLYDLELDAQRNVIGGEWYNNNHPDFLWNPTKGGSITTSTDKFLASQGIFQWNVSKVVDPKLSSYVSYESRRGSPLALIVKELFRASSTK